MPTESEVLTVCKTSSGNACKQAALDPGLVSALTDIINASLEMGKDGGVGVALGAASKASSLAGIAADQGKSTGAKAAVFASKELVATLNLIRLSSASPSSAIATIGATFLKKTALALDLVGDDDRKAKVMAALIDLAGQTVATGVAGAEAIVIEGGTMGLGTPFAIAMVVGNGAALGVAFWKACEAIRQP